MRKKNLNAITTVIATAFATHLMGLQFKFGFLGSPFSFLHPQKSDDDQIRPHPSDEGRGIMICMWLLSRRTSTNFKVNIITLIKTIKATYLLFGGAETRVDDVEKMREW